MFGVFKKIFGKVGVKRDSARYDKQKKIARSEDMAGRLTLAKNTRTHQEILYYLAEHDPNPAVRKAVAGNKSTPVHASQVLAADVDEDVRLELVKRLLHLLPELSKEKHSQLYAFVVQSLGMLALDEVLKIRIALSSALKDKAYAPPKVVGKLAHDMEREVSEPVLLFCTVLTDEELMDILKVHPSGWAVQAIAGRKAISAPISKAVIDTNNAKAGKILLQNRGAKITKELLKEIVDKARNYPEWHKPIATRKNLPPEVGKALAVFADASVRDLLAKRKDFDKRTVEEISKVFRRRLEFAGEEGQDNENLADRIIRLEKEKRLTEETVSDALAMRDRDFVYTALARMAGTDVQTVTKIFEMKAPKPIVALSWKAGLSMRFALQLQKEMGMVAAQELLYPRGGTDYPLTDDEILWQLEFLGVKAA